MRLRRNEQGMALLMALLFIVLLTVIVVEYCYETSVEASLIGNSVNELEAQVAARSAVAMGMSLLAADLLDTPDVSATDPRSRRSTDEPQSSGDYDSEQDVWYTGGPDAPPSYQEINGALMMWQVTDEYGKLNLNALIDPETGEDNPLMVEALRAFFRERGADEDPVDAILDWIDGPNTGDPNDETRSNGAESDYYAGLESPYVCKNKMMDSVEELLLVKGITPELYFGDTVSQSGSSDEPVRPLSEYLTVHGHPRGYVNANTAPREVLAALSEAAQTLGGNSIDPENIITARDRPFESTEDLTSRGLMLTVPADVFQSQQDGQDRKDRGAGKGRQGSQTSPPARGGPKQQRSPNRGASGADGSSRRPGQQQEQEQDRGVLEVASRVFRIRGDGISGDAFTRIEATVLRSGDPATANSGSRQTDGADTRPSAQQRDAAAGSRSPGPQGAAAATSEGGLFRILDWRVYR